MAVYADLSFAPFTEWAKSHRPLSDLLWRRAAPIRKQIAALTTVAELDQFRASRFDDLMLAARPQLPVLKGMRRARVDEPRWWTIPETSKRVETVRRFVALQVIGDLEVLAYWPDEVPAEPEPIDSTNATPGGLRFEDASHCWSIEPVGDSADPNDKEWALYTFVDLSVDEEEQVAAGTLDLKAIFQRRRDQIEPIADAVRQQTLDFFEHKLRAHLEGELEAKRRKLWVREAVGESLVFPNEWVLPVPAIVSPADIPTSDSDAGSDVLDVPATPRLSPVSFAGLQKTIRVWADSVERYPSAFSDLVEDRVSDLLAATLNATLPGAQREVYSRGGKSDLFIKADVLNEGSGPAKIFIAEAKWATSGRVVREAIDPQLFGYLTANDTSAVLLLLFRQGNFKRAMGHHLNALRRVHGFVSESESAVESWPLFSFKNQGRRVDVCVATVHIPSSDDLRTRRKTAEKRATRP